MRHLSDEDREFVVFLLGLEEDEFKMFLNSLTDAEAMILLNNIQLAREELFDADMEKNGMLEAAEIIMKIKAK